MHVVLLNQAFHPDVVATAQMAKDLADRLVAQGHTVSVVASRSIYGKSGATLPKRETIDGIHVYRVGASRFGKKSIAARAFDFGLFYVRAALRTLTLKKPDVVVCFTTPPFITLVGILTRLFRRSKCVCWLMDMYPDVAVASGVMKPTSLPTRFFNALNRWLLRRADVTIVLGRCMQSLVLDKGAPEDRVKFIPVWADTTGIEPVRRAENPYREKFDTAESFCVMYSGNWGIAHDYETICDAMRRVITVPPRDDKGRAIPVRFVFVGAGKRRPLVEVYIKEHKLDKEATYYDYVPRSDIGLSLGAADVHLMTVKEGMEGMIVPSKLFGVMAAGKPSLYVGSPESEIARIITETASGMCFAEGDSAGLAEAVRSLAADSIGRKRMGKNARDALVGQYDADTLCARWIDMLEELTQKPSQQKPTP